MYTIRVHTHARTRFNVPSIESTTHNVNTQIFIVDKNRKKMDKKEQAYKNVDKRKRIIFENSLHYLQSNG